MKYLTFIIIITTAVIIHSAGQTSLYRLEAKRNLLKSLSKECQIKIDSLETFLISLELMSTEDENSFPNAFESDPKRLHERNISKSSKGQNSSIISQLDSLQNLQEIYSRADKILADSIKAYLKGKP